MGILNGPLFASFVSYGSHLLVLEAVNQPRNFSPISTTIDINLSAIPPPLSINPFLSPPKSPTNYPRFYLFYGRWVAFLDDLSLARFSPFLFSIIGFL